MSSFNKEELQCPLEVTSNPYPIEDEILQSNLNEDYNLINNKDIWKIYQTNKATNDVCSIYKAKNDSVWWIKLVGDVDGDIDNIDNLLDIGIKSRQSEWHELYQGGYSIWRDDNNTFEICYFRYASTIFGVSPRDTCYIKIRRNLYCDKHGIIINSNIDTNSDSLAVINIHKAHDENKYYCGFLLSYRSIDLPELASVGKGYVRTIFSGAHLIKLKDITNKSLGYTYTYIQHANPGGWIPISLANAPQCDIIMKEIVGVRNAMKNPIVL